MASNSSIEIGSVSREPYIALRLENPVSQWKILSQISTDLATARFAAPSRQQMVVIGESTTPLSALVDRVIHLRPDVLDMAWDGDYLTIARRIKNMANAVGYQPKTSCLSAEITESDECTSTQGCRERLLFAEGKMTAQQLSHRQSLERLDEIFPPSSFS